MWFYSPSKRGFFGTDLFENNLPEDAIPITIEQYEALFLAQSDGLTIQPGEDGSPIALLHEPTHAELWEQAITEMRTLRQPIVEVLDGLQSSALTLGQTSRAQVIETAKQGLRDLTKMNLADCTTYEEMQQAVGAAYFALAAALPADIRIAFAEATK